MEHRNMPEWQNKPPTPTDFAGIRILRVPPQKALTGIITSDHLVGCWTHFAQRRTQPCNGADCPLCLEGQQPRWHGYVSVWNAMTRNHIVMEFTALAAQTLSDYEDRNGSLRGAELKAERTGNRPNSPVHTRVTAADHDLRQIPKAVDLERFLDHLWNGEKKDKNPSEEPPHRQNIRNINHPKPAIQPTQTAGSNGKTDTP